MFSKCWGYHQNSSLILREQFLACVFLMLQFVVTGDWLPSPGTWKRAHTPLLAEPKQSDNLKNSKKFELDQTKYRTPSKGKPWFWLHVFIKGLEITWQLRFVYCNELPTRWLVNWPLIWFTHKAWIDGVHAPHLPGFWRPSCGAKVSCLRKLNDVIGGVKKEKNCSCGFRYTGSYHT